MDIQRAEKAAAPAPAALRSGLAYSNDQLAPRTPQAHTVFTESRLIAGAAPVPLGELRHPSVTAAASPELQWFWGFSHASQATAAAYSPGGKSLAVGTDDGSVTLYDTESYETGQTLRAHFFSITGLAFHKARASLLTASADGEIREWDPSTGEQKRTLLESNGKKIRAIAMSPDEQYLAIARGGGGLALYSFSRGGTDWEKPAYREDVLAVTFHPTEGQIATVGFDDKPTDDRPTDGFVRVWSQSGDQLKELYGAPWQDGQKEALTSVAFDRTGRWLGAGGARGRLAIYDTTSYGPPVIVEAHRAAVTQVHCTPSGLLVSASADGSIATRRVGSWEDLRFFTAYRDSVQSIAIAQDDRGLVACGRELRLWDIDFGYPKQTLARFQGMLTSIAISGDGNRIFSLSLDGSLKICTFTWSPVKLVSLETVNSLTGATALARSPDDRLLAVGNDSGTIRVLALPGYASLGDLDAANDAVTVLLFGTTLSQLVAGYRSGAIRVWDPQARATTFENFDSASPVADLSLSPRGLLAAGFRDGTLSIVNLESREEVHRSSFGFGIFSVKFDSSGQYLLVGLYDGAVVALDANNGFEQNPPRYFDKYPILRMDTSTAGALAAVDLFGTLRLAQGAGWTVVTEQRDPWFERYAVALHPTLQLVATGGSRHQVELWTW